MRRLRITDLQEFSGRSHFLDGLIEGKRLRHGGLSFHPPGTVTHDQHRPHVETDQEVFCLLQGEGWIEINGVRSPACAGDIFIIEPGEDHHLISSHGNPFINLWLHADDIGHRNQQIDPEKAEYPNKPNNRPDIEAEVTLLTTEEGGLHKPFGQGARPGYDFHAGTINIGFIYILDREVAQPGETVKVHIWFLDPSFQAGRLYPGFEFTVNEAWIVIGRGVVTKVFNPYILKPE